MGNCKDCKYWEKGLLNHRDYNTCSFCNDRSPETEVGIEYEVLDDSGMDFELRTGLMFGCVNFSKKNN